jgi:hypothetical protein
MNKKHIIFPAILFLVFKLTTAEAQMLGNPITVQGKGQWTMSLSGTYLNQQLETAKVFSKRILAQSRWGLTSNLDVFGTLGYAQLKMNAGKPGIADYSDKFRFAYGLGFHFMTHPFRENGIGFWASAHAFTFPSKGAFQQTFAVLGNEYVRRFEMKYDWGEAVGSAGWMVPYRFVVLYAGVAGWGIQRQEEKTEYLIVSSGSTSLLGREKGTYQSGIWSGGVSGIRILLPQNYSFGIECLYFNRQSYQIMAGISQTGMTGW